MKEIYSRNSSRPKFALRRTREPLSLNQSLTKLKDTGKTGIIAEFKRKSPSGFSNSKSLDIRAYFQGISGNRKIAGFSVLTEPDFFNGNYQDISEIQDFNVPILDKDFISTKEMVDSAFNCGADAILLILDFLAPSQLYLLSDYAVSLGLEALIEFHELKLVDRIDPGRGRIFGYNRRNLETLKMEPQEMELDEVVSRKDLDIILESGITSEYVRTHDVSRYKGMLIGTSILDGDKVQEA